MSLEPYFNGPDANWEPVQESSRPALKLATKFSDKAYPFLYERMLKDRNDPVERSQMLVSFNVAINISGIRDYRLFDTPSFIKLHLKDSNDASAIKLAFETEGPGFKIMHPLLTLDADYDFRKLKKHCRYFNQTVNDTGFSDRIQFNVDRGQRTLYLVAHTKQAFFEFWYTPEFQHMMHHYKSMQNTAAKPNASQNRPSPN